jgi:hypothetical protein
MSVPFKSVSPTPFLQACTDLNPIPLPRSLPSGHLKNGHFIPELALLLGGEPQFVNDFYCYIPACLPVFSWGGGRKGKG